MFNREKESQKTKYDSLRQIEIDSKSLIKKNFSNILHILHVLYNFNNIRIRFK